VGMGINQGIHVYPAILYHSGYPYLLPLLPLRLPLSSASVNNRPQDILTVPELDALFIGRHALSLNLGIPGQGDNPEIQHAVDKAIKEGKSAGRAVGGGAINAGDPASVREFIKQGAQFFSLTATSPLRI